MPAFLASIKQESAQVFIISLAALYGFWQAGAPMALLYCVTVLSAIFIIWEKWRATRTR